MVSALGCVLLLVNIIMRAVQTMYGNSIHLRLDTDTRTLCGVIPFKNAASVINRKLMCMNCFGVDHGIGKFNAQAIGVVRIYEEKETTSTSK